MFTDNSIVHTLCLSNLKFKFDACNNLVGLRFGSSTLKCADTCTLSVPIFIFSFRMSRMYSIIFRKIVVQICKYFHIQLFLGCEKFKSVLNDLFNIISWLISGKQFCNKRMFRLAKPFAFVLKWHS